MTQIEMDAARAIARLPMKIEGINDALRDMMVKIDLIAAQRSAEAEIDWEQRRYEIAKSAITGIVGSDHEIYEYEYVAKSAVKFADALIKELKMN